VFGDSDDSQASIPARAIFTSILCTTSLCWMAIERTGACGEPQELPSSGLGARILAAATERHLFLYLEVDDSHFTPTQRCHPEKDQFDRVDLMLQRPDGTLNPLFSRRRAGPHRGTEHRQSDDGVYHAAPEPRIQAFWLQTVRGTAWKRVFREHAGFEGVA